MEVAAIKTTIIYFGVPQMICGHIEISFTNTTTENENMSPTLKTIFELSRESSTLGACSSERTDERSRPHYETKKIMIWQAVTYQSRVALELKLSCTNSTLLLCLARHFPWIHHVPILFQAKKVIHFGRRKRVAFRCDDEPRIREYPFRLRLCCCYR